MLGSHGHGTPGESEAARPEPHALRRADHLLLFGFCLLLFGYSMVGGRPLTMHEAIVPQTAREMAMYGDWVVPTVGGGPWLERPPLPQWLTITTCGLLGRCDREWIVRLPANVMGALVVLMVASLGARWFGRSTGLVAGLVLATMFEFVSYSWLSEPDIYLSVLVTAAIATFALAEIGRTKDAAESARFLGRRSWPVVAFFLFLGTTNLAKGFLFGTGMVLVPIFGYLVWNLLRTREWWPIQRYVWSWGWLVFAAVSVAWPLAVYRRYPDALDAWFSFHVVRLSGSGMVTEPFWYYLAMLPGELAPWTLFAAVGLVLCLRDLKRNPSDAKRFLVCWAVLPVAVFSFPSAKHHHYLVQCLAPWSILGAVGVQWLWKRLLKLHQNRSRWLIALFALLLLGCAAAGVAFDLLGGGSVAATTVALGLVICACALSWALTQRSAALALGSVLTGIVGFCLPMHSLILPARDQCVEDTAVLRQISSTRDPALLLVVNAASTDVFRTLFYLDSSTVTVQDLSHLDDERFDVPEILVITRARDRRRLEEFGEVSVVLQSQYSRREVGPEDRMTLFRLQYRVDLARRRHPTRISPMQAMGR